MVPADSKSHGSLVQDYDVLDGRCESDPERDKVVSAYILYLLFYCPHTYYTLFSAWIQTAT